jgi:hypothetical protein
LRLNIVDNESGDVEVEFIIEVTDMSSLVAAFLFAENTYRSAGIRRGAGPKERVNLWRILGSPRFLDIETYDTKVEKWTLTETQGEWKILPVNAPLIDYLMLANPVPLKDELLAKDAESNHPEALVMYYAVWLKEVYNVPFEQLKGEILPTARNKLNTVLGRIDELMKE